MRNSGLDRAVLHCFSSIAGNRSGPAAAVGEIAAAAAPPSAVAEASLALVAGVAAVTLAVTEQQ